LVAILILASVSAASPKGKSEPWVEMQSPHFLILTDANEKLARRVTYQFEMIHAVFSRHFSTQVSAKGQRVIVIAARDEATFKELLPEFWAERNSMHPAGVFLGSTDKNYVALRLDVSVKQDAAEPFEPVYHEYVHYLTRRMISDLPLWLSEGLAEFYGNTRIERNKVLLGAPSASNLRILHASPPLPLATLFGLTASSPYYHEESKTSIFYAESWALTHYLITRDWRERTHRVDDFLAQLKSGATPDEAARRTLGDPQALEDDLRNYINRFSFAAAVLAPPPDVDASSFELRSVSEAESLAMRADLMARDRHYTEAQAMLQQAMQLDPKLALAHEVMGFILIRQGKLNEATQRYAEAVALNPQDSMANYSYAYSLIVAKLTAVEPDADAAAKAEACLRAAIQSMPDFAPAYAELAWVLARRHKELDEAHRMILVAIGLEPGNLSFRFTAVEVLEAMGRDKDALRVANVAASMAKTELEQLQAQNMLTYALGYQQRVKAQEEAVKQGAAGARVMVVTPKLSPHSPRPELLLTQEIADGTIREVACSLPDTLEMTLATASGDLHFYNDNYFRIPYNAINFNPTGALNPCTDLQGSRARVTFHPARDPAKPGEIVEIGRWKK